MNAPIAPMNGNGNGRDPSANVLALVDAAVARVEDRVEGVREIVKLRADYEERLRIAETARIDAIRAVDVGNVTRAAEVSTQQASTLATQVAASAEALRAQVEATRITTADQLETALAPIRITLESLRQTQFTQQGEKSAVAETRVQGRDTRVEWQSWVMIAVVVVGALLGYLAAHYHG